MKVGVFCRCRELCIYFYYFKLLAMKISDKTPKTPPGCLECWTKIQKTKTICSSEHYVNHRDKQKTLEHASRS